MPRSAATRTAYSALASASRVRLLDAIRTGEQALTAVELAGRLGLQLSTVRFHLKELVRAALIEAVRDAAHRRGRPQLRYRAFHRAPDSGGYHLLAEILAQSLTDHSADSPGTKAKSAGVRWARRQMETRAADQRYEAPDVRQSAAATVAFFAELGFEPELDPSAPSDTAESLIHLHACPFAAMAKAQPDIVCAAHLGVLDGYLEGLGADGAKTRLQPWVSPGTCLAAISLPTRSAVTLPPSNSPGEWK
ncbi:helix-turn-helix domain-containing protein [Paeniglutamicibacter antarcticus]|uniref:Helix-turn-helix domain-containing protein n=1 Tax=Arthrobacter terrae TaxID=2935737 RepID=A0A931G651_9MICC|nr:helix-turn-helix domain-containing protein [Arthrobacter terrae]MBG0741566.1 helix-turn-helix domain-containing protein [Arthrobacter terrae]